MREFFSWEMLSLDVWRMELACSGKIMLRGFNICVDACFAGGLIGLVLRQRLLCLPASGLDWSGLIASAFPGSSKLRGLHIYVWVYVRVPRLLRYDYCTPSFSSNGLTPNMSRERSVLITHCLFQGMVRAEYPLFIPGNGQWWVPTAHFREWSVPSTYCLF